MKYTTFVAVLIVSNCICCASLDAADILYFVGSPTSFVSRGQTWLLSADTGYSFLGIRHFDQAELTNSVQFQVSNAVPGAFWDLDFVGPNFSLPVVGSYPNAVRFPFQYTQTGMVLDGDGRGDNTLTGSFQVLEAVFDGSGNLQKFAADFVQYDEGFLDRWNIGSIRFNSDIPITPVPEPSTVAPAALGAAALYLARRVGAHRKTPRL
jgi:hypothetical protein